MSQDQIIGEFLWDRAYARAVDQLSTERYLIPALVLMESAGRAVAEAAQKCGVYGKRVLVLAGTGNNGGDALVAARHLMQQDCEVLVYIVAADAANPRYSESCKKQLDILHALGVQPAIYQPCALQSLKRKNLLVIDGVLGLGFQGRLERSSLLFQALKEAAQIGPDAVVAVDVPSGLDVDDGEPETPEGEGTLVPLVADLTVTFGGKKPALVLSPARDVCGEVVSVDIGFPQQARDAAFAQHQPLCVLADARELLADDPWDALPRSAHKYDRGHVLVIGGSVGKTGAPLMAGLSALRSGAGWATIAMPQSALADLRGDVPHELTFEPLFEQDELNAIKLERFIEARRVKAVVVGPGCMASPLTPESVAVLAEFTAKGGFVVLDAGATHGAAKLLRGVETKPERWLLTPHPGEWRRLGDEFHFSPHTQQGLQRALALAQELGVALLYKSATPILFTGLPTSPAFVTDEGTLALARAGSGDVLSGAAAAHGAIGLPSSIAGLRAQVLVAWAAVLAGGDVGVNAVLADDILHAIGKVSRLVHRSAESAESEVDDDADDRR